MFSVISVAICEGEVRVGYLPLLVGYLAAGVRVSANTGKQWEMALVDYPWTFRPTFTLNDRRKIRNLFWHILDCIA